MAELVPLALKELRNKLGAEVTALYDFSDKDESFTLRARTREDASREPLPSSDPQLRDTLAGVGPNLLERFSLAPQPRCDITVAIRGRTKTYGILSATTSSATPFGQTDHEFIGKVAAILAIARRNEHRTKLVQSMFERSRDVFELNPNPMMLVDAKTLRYLDVNQTAIDVYGYTRKQWLTMTPYDLRSPEYVDELSDELRVLTAEGSSTFETCHRKADGTALDAHLSIVTIEYDAGKVHIVTVLDMTERNNALARSRRSEETLERAQRQLEHSALHDRLTGLPNRVLLAQRLEQAIVRAEVTGGKVAVLYIDVDEFKNVNDTLGHSAGDTLLSEISDRLRSNTRQGDCVGRMGGDEFILVLSDISADDDVAEVARQLGSVVAEPLRLAGREIIATCSIGIALFPQDGTDVETLLRNADTAMYRAKRDGRATARSFTPAMHDEAEQRITLEANLLEALRQETLALAYQPIYDLNGALKGSEALLRWPQTDGTVIQPNQFIPFAEESGLIVPIGAWVLRTACMQNAAWNSSGRHLKISVNVSGKQIADPHFVRTVQAALRDSGLAPDFLELELTETVMSANVDRNAAAVKELRALGVRISIDDFGTGYNSLATLRSYEVDTLKLDMCFVTHIAENPVDRAIASAVIAAAHSLGACVVAEGIETPAQLAALVALNCDCGQGYLFSKPVAATLFTQLLRSSGRPLAA